MIPLQQRNRECLLAALCAAHGYSQVDYERLSDHYCWTSGHRWADGDNHSRLGFVAAVFGAEVATWVRRALSHHEGRRDIGADAAPVPEGVLLIVDAYAGAMNVSAHAVWMLPSGVICDSACPRLFADVFAFVQDWLDRRHPEATRCDLNGQTVWTAMEVCT